MTQNREDRKDKITVLHSNLQLHWVWSCSFPSWNLVISFMVISLSMQNNSTAPRQNSLLLLAISSILLLTSLRAYCIFFLSFTIFWTLHLTGLCKVMKPMIRNSFISQKKPHWMNNNSSSSFLEEVKWYSRTLHWLAKKTCSVHWVGALHWTRCTKSCNLKLNQRIYVQNDWTRMTELP